MISRTPLNVLGIIPARYASTRLPGKPLLQIGEQSIIQHVYERSKEALEKVMVATDDARIYDEVTGFGGVAVMTSTHHQSGTDRVYEALELSGQHPDIVINIQGDEPFVSPTLLKELSLCFSNPSVDIATAIFPYPSTTSIAELSNPNQVKVVTSSDGFALYFSRSPIPFRRSEYSTTYFRHVGLYAFRSEVLRAVSALPMSPLEKSEGLEQLRWLQAGYRIKTIETQELSIGIDTPEDLEKARAYYSQREQ